MKTYRHVNRVWTNPCCSCCEQILIVWISSEWCIKTADSPLLSLYNAPLKSRLSDHSLLSRRLHHSNTGMATPTRRIHPSSSSSHAIRSLCCCPPQNRLVSPAHHTTRHNHSCITTNRVALSHPVKFPSPPVCVSPAHFIIENNATLLVVVFCLRLISCSLIVPPRRRRAGPRAVADRARPAGAAGPTASRASPGGRGWARPLQ